MRIHYVVYYLFCSLPLLSFYVRAHERDKYNGEILLGVHPHCPKVSPNKKSCSVPVDHSDSETFSNEKPVSILFKELKKGESLSLSSLLLYTHTHTQMSTTDTIVYAYTKSEARKPPMEKQQMPPLFDEPTTLQNWHKHVNWVQSILLLGTPLIGLYGALTTELQTKTLIWAIIYYYITGLGITAGM